MQMQGLELKIEGPYPPYLRIRTILVGSGLSIPTEMWSLLCMHRQCVRGSPNMLCPPAPPPTIDRC